MPPLRLPKAALAALAVRALSRKPLPERLVRLGHCMLVPALGASKQDDQLALGFKVEEGLAVGLF